MTKNTIPDSAKLPPKSLNEDTMDDELPRDDAADQHKPPINLGGSRQSGEGVTDADPTTGRADRKDRTPAPQFSNRK
jgi:hypothetical protein